MIETNLRDINKQIEPQTRAPDLQVLDQGLSLLIKKVGRKERRKLNQMNKHNHCKLHVTLIFISAIVFLKSFSQFLKFFPFLKSGSRD